MGHIRLAANLAWCVLLASAAGCASVGRPPRPDAARPAAIRGTVRLAVLERANPQRVFLDSVDQAIREAQSPAVPPVSIATPPSRKDAKMSRSAASLKRTQRIAVVQEQRLAALQAEILSSLDARLARADHQRLASIRSRLNADAEQDYSRRGDEIDDEAESGERLATEQDRDAAVNLLTEIAALTVDTHPPPTAPDGYWQARLAARQSELDALEARRHALIAQIRSGRDEKRQDLRTQLQASADAAYAEAVASAETRRSASVKTARVRLQAQTADIIAASKSLDTEADSASLKAAHDLKTMPGDREEPALPALIPAKGGGNLAALLEERRRIQERILRQTKQTVAEVARSRNAVVVGYSPAGGVPDITDEMLRWIRADRWG